MRQYRRGFTLLELLISIALMLIVMMMLRTMFTSAQHMYVIASRRVEVFSQARVAMDLMEQDVLRMRQGGDEDSVQVRSLSLADLTDPVTARENFYSALSDFDAPEDSQSPKMKEFLSFIGSTTWYDKQTGRYETGDARIYYYLKARPASTEGRNLDGAYLVRRILPVRTSAEIVKAAKDGWRSARDIKVHEEEIATYVHSVRVYVDDKVSFQLGVDNKATYNIYPEAVNSVKWLWLSDPSKRPYETETIEGKTVALAAPAINECVTFAGEYITMSSPTRKHVMSLSEYPSVIVIELTLVDRFFSRADESGIYRTLTRAIQLPWAVPSRVFDQRDRDLIRNYGVAKQ